MLSGRGLVMAAEPENPSRNLWTVSAGSFENLQVFEDSSHTRAYTRAYSRILVHTGENLGSRCSVAAPRFGGLRLLSCALSRYFLHFSSLSAKHSDDGKRASHGSADGAP